MNALVQQEARAIGAVHSFDDMERMASVLAQSGLFGVKNPTQALALMLVAQAEGEHPASVAQDYDIIQGKGSRKTHSVLARFQAMGGKVEWHELSHTRADATFSHPKGGSLRLDWTIEQAKTAGLTGKDNWKGYARSMLRARCIAEGVRAVYPAAIGGWQVPEEAMGPQLDAPAPAAPKDMGPADVVQQPAAQQQAQPQPEGPQPWPDDALEKRFAKAREWLAAGKTHADIVQFLETKGTLTDAQKAKVRALTPAASEQQAQDVEPKVTYAAVADKIVHCMALSSMPEAEDLINSVADEQQRKDLQALVADRRAYLEERAK